MYVQANYVEESFTSNRALKKLTSIYNEDE